MYVHLPWCVRKCPYCDFNSHTAGDRAPFERYVDALLVDLELAAAMAAKRPVISVFLGGGTPSLFPPQAIARLMERISTRLQLCGDAEVTMEANPGTVECGDPAAYRSAGVNRLSIGAQSFDAASLQQLGRIHAVDDIERAVVEARAAGFAEINIDLMYALPGQTVDGALADIRRAAALGPSHVSWYQLTLEPNTVFHARPPAGLPDEDATFAIQQAGQALLSELGYVQYEISAWSKRHSRCRHNLNYWEFGDYLAIGAGAHGKISDAGGVCRYRRPANPLSYMQALAGASGRPQPEPVSADDLLFEFMLNALRLTDGFEEARFEARTGLPAHMFRGRIEECEQRGLVEKPRPGCWRATDLGRRFLNDLQAVFLPLQD